MTDLKRIETLFQAALELPPAERDAFLDRACAGEPELRDRVRAMLADDARGDSLAVPGLGDAADLGPSERVGSVIDRYKLLQQIGEGGFGVVYMAEQETPVRRKVALKIIKLGMDTREVVARFEAERQALALMDHPNIAKVLDGGATSTGRPYFVMELVRGISITEYCDRNRLPTDERLALFMQVCQAVQHAHQKGVIHRDLKPSNVLVTMNDGAPMPKVIDFGIAKAMHTRLTEKTLFTQFQRFIGTPAYMSPEQAELSALDVDTRTDIYSLGVLLYELLTGTVPFDPHTLVEAGLGEIQRVIREVPPERPSLRVSSSGDATTASSRGTADVRGLSKLMRGDLDWIVMKCLEKERGRRYATALELAADVQRHLDDVPVVAGPPSRVYRLRKFVARNTTGVVSGGVVALALLAGVVATALARNEAARQRDEALDAKHEADAQRNAALDAQREAEAQRNLALGVTDFLVETLALADPGEVLVPDLPVRAVLDRAAQRVPDAFAGQPEAEARVRATIGRAYESMSEHELAETHLRRAVELYAGLDADPAQRFEALWSLTHVCFNLERPDAFEMAEGARVVGLAAIRARHPELATALERLTDTVKEGTLGMRSERMEDVPGLFEAAARASNRNLSTGDPLWTVVTGLYAWCGFSMWYGPWEELSIPIWREALEVERRELPPTHPGPARTLAQYVTVLSRAGRGEDAERAIQGSLERLRTLLGPDGTHVAFLEGMLGQALLQQGRLAEAEAPLVHSYEVLASHHPATNFLVVDAVGRVADLYARMGDEARASVYRARIAEALSQGALFMPWPIASLAFGPELAPLLGPIETLRAFVGEEAYFPEPVADGPEVAAAIEAVLAGADELLPESGPLATLFARYLAYWEGGVKHGALEPHKERMVEAALSVLGPQRERFPIVVAELLARQADFAARRGEKETALELAAEARDVLASTAAPGDWFTVQATVRVARVMVELGLFAAAEPILVPAYDVLEAQLGPGHTLTGELRALIAETYAGLGRDADAARFRSDPAPR